MVFPVLRHSEWASERVLHGEHTRNIQETYKIVIECWPRQAQRCLPHRRGPRPPRTAQGWSQDQLLHHIFPLGLKNSNFYLIQ